MFCAAPACCNTCQDPAEGVAQITSSAPAEAAREEIEMPPPVSVELPEPESPASSAGKALRKTPTSPLPFVRRGTRVELDGLSKATELNGAQGVVLCEKGDRWVVDAGTEKLAVSPKNLVLKGGFYFHPGEDVLVRGSGGSSGAELNGQAGQIIAYVPERGLYKVLVAGKEILVKESDLALPHPEWDHDHSQIN